MKSLTDLYTSKEQNIDSRDFFETVDLAFLDSETRYGLEDFSPKDTSISLSGNSLISISPNKTYFFDSLTPKTSRFFGLKETLLLNFKTRKQATHKKYFRFLSKIGDSFRTSLSQKSIFLSFRFTPIIGFLLIIFSLLWLDKIFVENRVLSGYQKILNLQERSSNLETITKTINNARFDFLLADLFFIPFRFLPIQDIKDAQHAISGGKYLSKSLDRGLSIYYKTEKFVNKKSIENVYFTQLLQNIAPEFQDIEKYLTISLFHYDSIEDISDIRISSELKKAKILLRKTLSSLKLLNKDYEGLMGILGHNQKRKYLVVFQNADEIRPTGGFMGSMGIMELFRGKIQDFEMRDVYSFEWDLKRSPYQRIPAPPGIDTLTDIFGLRDANYFINIRDSSENIRFFVENSGQDIDGILYVNQNILLDFLKLTGGLYFEPVGRIIDEANFSEIMSLLVEAKLFKVGSLGTPKQILFDFVKVYQSLLLEKKRYFEYIQIFTSHVKARDTLMYSFRPRENDLLEGVGLNGSIDYNQTLDFTYPVFTSLSGNKSDRYMQRIYSKEILISPDCNIKTIFKIGQRHTFNSEKESQINTDISNFQIKNKNTIAIQGKGKNKQFIRVMIPYGSQVQLSESMNLVDYGSRKGVEFYTTVEEGQFKENSFSYTLSNPDCKNYSFMFYKQPGIRRYDLEIKTPESKELFSGLKQDFFYDYQR